MQSATMNMSDLLKKSVTSGKATKWRTHQSNFHESPGDILTPGCINISPCWFQQGREVSLYCYCYWSRILYSFGCQLSLGRWKATPWPWGWFSPEVSTALKSADSLSMTVSMQCSALLTSVALRVMWHPDLYEAGVDALVKIGRWALAEGLDDMLSHLEHWASVYNVVSVMCNRRSPPH
jgi:hypothetical protein